MESRQRDVLASDGIAAALEELDPRSRRIVEERWLKVNDDGSGGLTLHDLAAEYGVSAERIRQIESAAMKKMNKALAAYACTNAVFEHQGPVTRAFSELLQQWLSEEFQNSQVCGDRGALAAGPGRGARPGRLRRLRTLSPPRCRRGAAGRDAATTGSIPGPRGRPTRWKPGATVCPGPCAKPGPAIASTARPCGSASMPRATPGSPGFWPCSLPGSIGRSCSTVGGRQIGCSRKPATPWPCRTGRCRAVSPPSSYHRTSASRFGTGCASSMKGRISPPPSLSRTRSSLVASRELEQFLLGAYFGLAAADRRGGRRERRGLSRPQLRRLCGVCWHRWRPGKWPIWGSARSTSGTTGSNGTRWPPSCCRDSPRPPRSGSPAPSRSRRGSRRPWTCWCGA